MSSKHQLLGFIRVSACMLLCAYLMFISWRLFFYAYGDYYRSYSALPEYNLIPFKTIISLIVDYRHYKLDAWIYNLFGNIAAFMPLGILVPIVLSTKRRFRSTVIFSLTFLAAAETAQLVFRVGVFDVDDIMLNMTGVMLGYMIYKLLLRLNRA